MVSITLIQIGLSLYLNGLKQSNDSFIETNSTTITLKTPIDIGDRVQIEWIQFSNVANYIHGVNHITGGNDVIPQMLYLMAPILD